MSTNPSDQTLGLAFPGEKAAESSVVHDRPTLGSMPGARRDRSALVRPLTDLLCSILAVVVVALLAGASAFPAFPLAPLLVLAVCGILGAYAVEPSKAP